MPWILCRNSRYGPMQNMLTLVQGEFNPALLDNCWLAIAATDNEAVNQRVSASAEERRIFCNVVDAPQQASFIMPSIIDRSPLMVAVSSGGTSPVLARLPARKAGISFTAAFRPAGPLRRSAALKSKETVCHRRRAPTLLGRNCLLTTGWRSRWPTRTARPSLTPRSSC
ncbi:Siroheme synthase / Precorrin-2 oxidase [Klebsiella michiganensis]|nr:Siroheme synthase / Precorrin-2 oxidase [Klebsiella michiganensis]